MGIVFWHWGLFCYREPHNEILDSQKPPLYDLFKLFYLDGFRSVDLFFCLSGFVFFWLYADKIANGKTLAKDFFVLRFSRLYPLHFVTLLVVAVGQWIMIRNSGASLYYPNNDPFHFVLQLFFVSNWLGEFGFSFNGPVWSVSVEVLLYIIFFIISVLRFNRWWHLLLFVLIGHLLVRCGQRDLSRGIVSFFLGGLIYQVFLCLWRRGLSGFLVSALILLTSLLWILIPYNSANDCLRKIFEGSYLERLLTIHHKNVLGLLLLQLTQNSYELILFPLTLLTLSTWEAYRGTLGKRLSFLGNISYSVYLIHFPLLLWLAIVAHAFSISRMVYFSPWALIAFFCALLPLSFCSYHFLERPAQLWLRTKLL